MIVRLSSRILYRFSGLTRELEAKCSKVRCGTAVEETGAKWTQLQMVSSTTEIIARNAMSRQRCSVDTHHRLKAKGVGWATIVS